MSATYLIGFQLFGKDQTVSEQENMARNGIEKSTCSIQTFCEWGPGTTMGLSRTFSEKIALVDKASAFVDIVAGELGEQLCKRRAGTNHALEHHPGAYRQNENMMRYFQLPNLLSNDTPDSRKAESS